MFVKDKGICFIPIPKTGTQSVKHILEGRIDIQDMGGHPTYLDMKDEVPADTKFFTIVRRPDERLVSAIQYAWVAHCNNVGKVVPFDEFLDRTMRELLSVASVSPIAAHTDENCHWRDRWQATWFDRISSFVHTAQSFWLEGSGEIFTFKMDKLANLANWLNAEGIGVAEIPHKNKNVDFAQRSGFRGKPVGPKAVRDHRLFDLVLERYQSDWDLYKSAM